MSFAVWGPGLIVTLFGVIGAAMVVAVLGRLQSRASDRDTRLRDLDERIEHAVAQLRDLQLQEGRIEPSFFATQRAELEARAAAALRERDAVLSSADTDTINSGPDRPRRAAKGRGAKTEVSPTVAWFAARPWAKALVWVAGIGAVGGVLAASLTIEPHARQDGSVMGGAAQARAPMEGATEGDPSAPGRDSEIRDLLARVQNNPKDVEAMLGLVKRLLREQMFDEADRLLGHIKELDPTNATARVYSAVTLAARGSDEQATRELDTVTKEHPDIADGWFFRGMLAMQGGDNERMRDSFEHFMAVAPPGPQRDSIRGFLQGTPSP